MSDPAFLIDECLPLEVTPAFRRRGLDAVDIAERSLRGLKDDAVWTLAAAERRILVTRDLDFPLQGMTVRPPGLVLLRAPDDTTAPQLGELVASLLDALAASALGKHHGGFTGSIPPAALVAS